jgi:hypothetical protein
MERKYTKTVFAVVTFTAGVIAAYLMLRRGVPPLLIAKKTLLRPVRSLISEVATVAAAKKHA